MNQLTDNQNIKNLGDKRMIKTTLQQARNLLPFRRQMSNEEIVRAELDVIFTEVTKAHKQQTKIIKCANETLQELHAQKAGLNCLTQTHTALKHLRYEHSFVTPDDAVTLLREQSEQVESVIKSNSTAGNEETNALLIKVLSTLFLAQDKLSGFCTQEAQTNTIESVIPAEPACQRIVIPSELLYQAHHTLFPEEKMIVASGRKQNDVVTISGLFEVTGERSMSHVRADPTRLGRALISMSLTDSYFALWLHSHPGMGKGATHPSQTDFTQHKDWMHDYSKQLVSAIVVRDRFIRFWGKALETGAVTVEIAGPGIIKEKGENGHEIYRLEQ